MQTMKAVKLTNHSFVCTVSAIEMASSNAFELLKPHFASIKVPTSRDKVFKDECAFSFDSPVIFSFASAPSDNVFLSQ